VHVRAAHPAVGDVDDDAVLERDRVVDLDELDPLPPRDQCSQHGLTFAHPPAGDRVEVIG
jgi:hypothetical protein